MANQQEQVMAEFVQWLPSNISKFQGQVPEEIISPIANAKSPEEVVGILNELSKSEEGNKLVGGIFQVFQKSKKGVFKDGGKLSYLLNKFQNGGNNPKVTSKKRTDVMEKAKDSVLPRGGDAILTEYPDGTKKYTLTRNEQGYMSNSTNGTYFPYEESSIIITPQGDTTGVYKGIHSDAFIKPKTYTTKFSSDNYKLSHPFWGLNRNKTRVIPEGWWRAFNSNFGLERK